MKTLLNASLLISFLFLIITSSCRHIVIVNSKAVIVNRSYDVVLNDSALIYGTAFFGEDVTYPMQNVRVWIEGSKINTTTDSKGHFDIKLLPGTYTVKFLGENYEDKFTATLSNLPLARNEKVEITFLHGYIVE